MKKIFLQFIVVITVCASLVVTNGVSASEKAFKDVSIYFWAKPNINHLVELGAIDGLEDGTFGIGKNVTRAQVSKIIVESLNLEPVTSNNKTFTDVRTDHWAKDYIETLSSNGIIDGYEDGTFQPNKKLTRGQMAKILSNSFELKEQANKRFKDVPKSHWTYEYVMKLSKSGMTTGYDDNTYRPNNAVTREQMVVFVSRGIAKRDGITLPNPPKKPTKKTDKYPYNKTLKDPISNPPSKAKLIEYDRSFHSYSYKKALPGGGEILEVMVDAKYKTEENTVYIFGKDKKGDKYTAIYTPDDLNIVYAHRVPATTSDGRSVIYDVAGEFALAYGWQDIYNMIEVNVNYKGKSYYFASNTNAKTLGEELDRHNKYDDKKYVFKEVNGERFIHAFDDAENNDKYKWIITSGNGHDELPTQNIDAIKIGEERYLWFLYVEK